MTAALTAPAAATTSDLDPVHLICCCDENIALCGEDLTDVPWTEDLDPPCPICFTLETERCARCGCAADCGADIHDTGQPT